MQHRSDWGPTLWMFLSGAATAKIMYSLCNSGVLSLSLFIFLFCFCNIKQCELSEGRKAFWLHCRLPECWCNMLSIFMLCLSEAVLLFFFVCRVVHSQGRHKKSFEASEASECCKWGWDGCTLEIGRLQRECKKNKKPSLFCCYQPGKEFLMSWICSLLSLFENASFH